MFKFDIQQVVYYMKANKVYDSVIRYRCYEEGCHGQDPGRRTPEVTYRIGRDNEKYDERQLFESKEELLASL